MDASRPPIGERQRKAILAEIVAGGDTAEKHYLEVKRELDFSSKEESTKIVKFILGAANRLPSFAARNFGGYAVMIIGAEKGRLPGVPAGTEILDIEQQINKFMQPGGPAWELDREPADEPGRDVLFILVDPPKDGDPIFLCRAEFQGAKPISTLRDGDIYVRAQGQTRKATAAEIDALIARAKSSTMPAPELTVKLTGDAHFLDPTPDKLDNFTKNQIAEARRKHVRAAPKESLSGTSPQAIMKSLGALSSSLSTESFERIAREWEENTRSNWQENFEKVAGAALPGLVLELRNLQPAFLEGVRLDLILEDAYGTRVVDSEDVDLGRIFPPVIKSHDPFGYGIPDFSLFRSDVKIGRNPLTWTNDGKNLHITVELTDLRPGTPWVSGGDDFVVLCRQKTATSLAGSWQATVRGHHEAFEGTISLPVGEPQTLQSLVQRLEQADTSENND